MAKPGLAAIAGILLITLYSKGDAGHAFVYNCCNYILHKPPLRRIHNWWDSLDLCKQNGSALVSIETKEELNFLKEILSMNNLKYEYYIGLRKLSGKWRWISNNSIVVVPHKYPWAPGQPSENGNCTKMYFGDNDRLRYDDIPCGRPDRKIGLICERPVDCRVKTGRIGCYGNFHSSLLGDFRDEIQWISVTPFWKQMKKIVDKCAQLAFKQGLRFFAVENFGNCYGARDFSPGSQRMANRCNFGVGLANFFYVYKVSM